MYKYLFALALILASPTFAADKHAIKPGGAVAGEITVTATVQTIDHKTRQVTLKKDDGTLVDLKVGPAARNLDQVKAGDKVTFTYMEAIAIDVREASGQLGDQETTTLERAAKGAKPAGVIKSTYTVKALVEDIDYKTRHITLRGAEGDILNLKVGEAAKRFNNVKKGDHVIVQYTEALGISVTTPKS